MSGWKPFVTPVLKGQRFSGRIPLEILPELAAYRDLIREVARELFYQSNPDRKRVPKGFLQRFELQLHNISEGSTVLAIERRVEDSPVPSLFGAAPDEFEDARDLVEECISAVSAGKPVPTRFPEFLLPRFNGFGQKLREDEWLE